MSSDIKTILVTRKTRFEELVFQYNTEDQAAFVIKSRGGDFAEYRAEHTAYYSAVARVETLLRNSARVQRLERQFLPNFIFGPQDIVVVVGQDGLVANTLKYLSGQLLIAINPDPHRIDGVLLPFSVADTETIFADVARGTFKSIQITMAKALLNDGQELLAVNDLFIGPRLQVSARYQLEVDEKKEIQSSSGIIVSTGLGSTGWIKSIAAGAAGLYQQPRLDTALAWDANLLRFAVREPFPSQTTGTSLVYGDIAPDSSVQIVSMMSTGGVIFSDGMVDDFIEFNSGAVAKISIQRSLGRLVE